MDNTRRAPDMVYRKLDLTRVDDIELLALLGGRDARSIYVRQPGEARSWP